MRSKAAIPWALGSILWAGATPGLWAMQSIDRVTCDGASCPRPLELEDGRAVTITLTGQRLDALTAAEVIDGTGSPVTEVSVEVLPLSRAGRARVTRGTSTRGVTVRFAGGPARSGLRLRLTTSAGRRLIAPLDLSTAPAAMPDLRVSHVQTIDPYTSTDPLAARFTVTNAGRAAAVFEPGTDIYRATGDPFLHWTERRSQSTRIEPGGVDVVEVQKSKPPRPDFGEYDWTFTIDPQDHVPESDENNNTATAHVSFGTPPEPAVPDLAITSVRTDPPTPQVNREHNVFVDVENVGTGTHERHHQIRVTSPDCPVTFSGIQQNQYHQHKPVAPSETLEFRGTSTPGAAGQKDCRFRVDGDGPDADPGNDELRHTWTVLP